LLAEGRTIEATQLIASLTPGPSRAVLSAKLDSIDSRGGSIADIIGDTTDWPHPERLEAALIVEAASGYGQLSEVLESSNGFIWTVVKQGPGLLRQLSSLSNASNASAMNVLDHAGIFNAAFRPSEVTGAGGYLTDRERALLRLLPSHLTYGGIAAELCLSVNTVKANLKTLYCKLGAASRSEAVQRASEAGLS
jgi:DNA-binding NarL/FixJ family response regulator